MSSDSSDDENLDLLREATDTQFINDSMFKKETSDFVINENIPSKIETLQSLRKKKDEDEQFNLFHVSPEFQNYVAKHLSIVLEKKIQKLLVTVDNNDHSVIKKKKKYGVRLFSNSKYFLKVGTNHCEGDSQEKVNHHSKYREKSYRNLKYSKSYNQIDQNLLKEIAVDPNDILSKKDTEHWSKRSKAQVFHYKKSVDGQLVLVEPEFRC